MSAGESSKLPTLTCFTPSIIPHFARSSLPFFSPSAREKREEAGPKKKAIVTMVVEIFQVNLNVTYGSCVAKTYANIFKQ